MTEKTTKTLQLKPQAATGKPTAPRPPVRPRGPARARPLSEVQAERAAYEAAREAWNPPGERSAPRGPARPGGAPAGRQGSERGERGDRGPRNERTERGERPPGRANPAARAPRPPAAERSPGDGIRLNKRLADLGLCSRREADEWIERGWVEVNGQTAQMGQAVTEADRIDVLPAAQHRQDSRVTILLHKPVGYVSAQAEDGHESAAVLVQPRNQWRSDPLIRRGPSWQPQHARGLAPAGRLDIDSTGLLVLTQDGRVARTLIGEDSGIEKEYLVRVHWAPNGPKGADVVTQDVQAVFPAESLALLRHGLSLDDQPLKPAQVDWQNPEQLRFVLTEGKKRQIRRMCEQVGLHVVGLKRIRMGRIVLGHLPVGQWRYLRPDERF